MALVRKYHNQVAVQDSDDEQNSYLNVGEREADS